jgi:acyl-CoA thioesterase
VSEFDDDVAVERAGDDLWRGTITSRWDIGFGRPNGGYLLALALAPLPDTLGLPDPFTATAHYLRPPAHGPVDLHVEVVRRGRRHSTAMVRMVQDGVESVRVLATYGDLDAREGLTAVTADRPGFPPPEQCVRHTDTPPPPFPIEFVDRVDARIPPSLARGPDYAPTGGGEYGGWLRLADGREPDSHLLTLVADAFPPAVANLARTGYVPTIELTVHVRERPAAGWLECLFRTRFLLKGYIEEDGEVWDSEGRLVALSRQLAIALPFDGPG